MNKPTVTLKKRMGKKHFDSRRPLTLEFKDGMLVKQPESGAMSMDEDYYTFQHSENQHAFEFSQNDIGDEDESEFEDSKAEEFAMAKAYDNYDDEDEINANLHNPAYAGAKAYEGHEDEELPADRDNAYSDVFEMDDEELFKDTELAASEQPSTQFAVADEVDVDDRFARDLEAILTGKKSLANLADYTDDHQAKNSDSTKDAASAADEKMQKDAEIFEKFAASQKAMTSYQLGEVELGSLFDEVDLDLDRSPTKKKPLTPEEVRKVVDDTTTVALSDMDFAEDFEIIDSIAEAQAATQKKEVKSSDVEEAIEEVITVEPEELSEK